MDNILVEKKMVKNVLFNCLMNEEKKIPKMVLF